jgi:hypothetical protein
MSILNFKEIPQANCADGQQDSFELFARDFLERLGYEVDVEPGRGADGGKDLILKEIRKGISGDTTVRWLVSCKHKAHSGSAVSRADEPEVSDSVRSHNCHGFIGFYSTLPSSSLIEKVKEIPDIEYQFFDYSKIERELLSNPSCLDIAKRYFPESFKAWSAENPSVAQIFSDHAPFKCVRCDSILDREHRGIVACWQKYEDRDGRKVKLIKDYYTCCGGECDQILQTKHLAEGFVSAWSELQDYFNPTLFLKAAMSFYNELYDLDVEYTKEAFENRKRVITTAFPYVARNLTKSEAEQVNDLGMIPQLFGGFG